MSPSEAPRKRKWIILGIGVGVTVAAAAAFIYFDEAEVTFTKAHQPVYGAVVEF